jgi:hypothetical protein
MEDDAAHLRKLAHECRQVAAQAKDPQWRESLLTLAKDLDEEADTADAEAAGR